MSNNMIYYVMGGTVVAFVIIIIAYEILSKKMQKSEYKRIQKLQQGTKESNFSTEILFQKLYLTYIKIPFLKRYVLKLRRRLEIINIDDEYITRKESAKILTKALAVIAPVMVITIIIAKSNALLMAILLMFELFMIDTLIDGSVDKIDNVLLKEQIEFFSEIRHAYHEFNMVEEAIYQVSQDEEKNVSRQGEKIYEVLISDDPETELEKYYDIAPNSFLKEFAGISYLTKEFGDRKVNGASLYLKNVNNITQEMQLEILKRDKLNYVFQSLSVISIVPILMLEPLRSWAVSNFSFTANWYNGKSGMIVQILILLITFLSYILVRKLKDNGSTNINTKNTENPWQEKIYKKKPIKRVVDLFIPKKGTKEYRKTTQMLKDSASPLKMEWLYVNRISLAIVTFIVSIIVFSQLHMIAINYVYTEPTTEYDIIGDLDAKDKKKADELTKQDNEFLDKFRGKTKTTQDDIKKAVDNIINSNPRNFDIGKINDKYFINVASAGMFTDVSQKINPEFKNSMGKVSYYLKGIEEALYMRKFSIEVNSSEINYNGDMYLMLIFNGKTAGNINLAYKAEIDDGLLDVIIVKKILLPNMLPLLINILKGEHLEGYNKDEILYFKTNKLKIDCKDNLNTDIDGEKGPDFPLEIECIKDGIELLGY